jgi:hypothetical protein
MVFFLAAFACFCAPCLTAKLTRRVGDPLLTCCLNPCTLMAVRVKVRTAYKIKVNISISALHCIYNGVLSFRVT